MTPGLKFAALLALIGVLILLTGIIIGRAIGRHGAEIDELQRDRNRRALDKRRRSDAIVQSATFAPGAVGWGIFPDGEAQYKAERLPSRGEWRDETREMPMVDPFEDTATFTPIR